MRNQASDEEEEETSVSKRKNRLQFSCSLFKHTNQSSIVTFAIGIIFFLHSEHSARRSFFFFFFLLKQARKRSRFSFKKNKRGVDGGGKKKRVKEKRGNRKTLFSLSREQTRGRARTKRINPAPFPSLAFDKSGG